LKRVLKFLLWALLAVVGVVLVLVSFMAYSIFLAPVPAAKPNTVRVACVGDSITFGNPFFPSKRYPQQLEDLLGSAYSVRNFGAVGYTAQKEGDHPYWQHRYFKQSSEFAPDIVVIMLGTNDSKTQNWSSTARFTQDLQALIQHYQSLPKKPRIVLVTPPSAFLVKGHSELPSAMNAKVIAEISDGVKQLGAAMALPVVDVHSLTASHSEFFKFDGVHPDGDGDHLIAKAIYDELIAAKP
jgi:acyl-CoA thioesterase I